MKRMNNDMAVSPIVATLVLIVVAVIGAVAVGTIMGTFSTSVSKNVNANQASSASQTELLIAGSTTVSPITEAAGALYTQLNPGVKITNQAIASGAGIQAVGNGVADIGETSDPANPRWTNQFPQLQPHLIGYGIIAIITNAADPANQSATYVSYADLQQTFAPSTTAKNGMPAYTGTYTTLSTSTVPVGRADSSGTASVFYKFLGATPDAVTGSYQQSTLAAPGGELVNGNMGVISTVGATHYAIGYADYGDAVNAASSANGATPSVIILPYTDGTGAATWTPASGGAPGWYMLNQSSSAYFNAGDWASTADITNMWNAFRGEVKEMNYYTVEQPQTDNGLYPQTSKHAQGVYNLSLIRPLTYWTNGAPNTAEQNFITFVQTNPQNAAGIGVFQATNNFGLPDVA